uniref:Nucleoporin_N domain-containing protein n=1 Tax=Schistosoma curassoni TaxID=6186 RepID=A0A183JWM7_9TREM
LIFSFVNHERHCSEIRCIYCHISFSLLCSGNCVVFATEAGQLHLYIHDINSCQFNTSPLPTEFASPFPESLWPTNTLQTTIPVNYSLMIFDDPTNTLYGSNLAGIGKTAAESVGLQMLAASIHQPPESLSSPDFLNLVERRKAEAAREAVLTAYKPIEYDDYRFSLASVPFAAYPPPIFDSTNNPIEDESSCIWKAKLDTMCTSDWPEDLNKSQHKVMNEVDPDLLNNANRKRAVRKPPHWGTVWHPYSTDEVTMNSYTTHNNIDDNSLETGCSSPLQLGRFEHVAMKATTTTTINATIPTTTIPAITSSTSTAVTNNKLPTLA